MKILQNTIKVIGFFLAILIAILVVLSIIPAKTDKIEGNNAISSLESVQIGGIEQWLTIRSEDISNPILLYLHGGPGMGYIPFGSDFNSLIEKHFVVVHWDQRGAGKTCGSNTQNSTLNLEQYLSDTLELINYLRQRFTKQKIYLVGHSWGSVLGVKIAQRHPELFHAYVGVGQVVDMNAGEAISYQFVLDRATQENNEKALSDLAEVKPPYESIEALMTQRQWLGNYSGDRLTGDSMVKILTGVLSASEYTLSEKMAYYGCVINSLEQAWDDLQDIDFKSSIKSFDLPIYFFAGRYDYNTPSVLVEEWVSQINAPVVELVWFENSAHYISSEEPIKFQQALIDHLLIERKND